MFSDIKFIFGICILLVVKSEVVQNTKKDEVAKGNKTFKCPESDEFCSKDPFGYEAIRQLHSVIDDDADGSLNREESDEFLRDELEYEDGFDRHSNFHGADDNITVQDLWHLWTKSPVYNWTVDDVVEWLEGFVDMPQYVETFRVNAVEGRILPRIALNGKYTQSILGIKNAIDKQKLAVKAQDLVLFGPPKLGHNYIKDLLLVFSIVVAAGGCWLAYMQNKYSQDHLKKLMKDLDTLQKAEQNVLQLQQKLDEAHKEKDNVAEQKKCLEEKMEDEISNAKQEADQLRQTRECTDEEIGRLKLAEEELEQLKRALERAEYELRQRPRAQMGELQQWLQLTYEVESKYCATKREAAEKQLILAKEMCEKIRRKRGAFLGSLRVAHTTSVDDTDHSISCARSALEEVKQDIQERTQRWHQIEAICGFNIISNPGYDFLDSLLRSPMGSSVSTSNLQNLSTPLNADDADEDIPPGAYTSAAAFYGSTTSGLLLPSTMTTPNLRRTPSPRHDEFIESAQMSTANADPTVSHSVTSVRLRYNLSPRYDDETAFVFGSSTAGYLAPPPMSKIRSLSISSKRLSDSAKRRWTLGSLNIPGMRRSKTDATLNGKCSSRQSIALAQSAAGGYSNGGSFCMAPVPLPAIPDMTLDGFAPAEGGVWPQLMRAGMQLTMLGFDLTDPRLRALHPLQAVSEIRERRSTGLGSAQYGGSRDPVHSNYSTTSAATMCGPSRGTAFRPVTSPLTASCSHSQTSSGPNSLTQPHPQMSGAVSVASGLSQNSAHSNSVTTSAAGVNRVVGGATSIAKRPAHSSHASTTSGGSSSEGAGPEESEGAGPEESLQLSLREDDMELVHSETAQQSGAGNNCEMNSLDSHHSSLGHNYNNGRVEFGLHELGDTSIPAISHAEDSRIRAQTYGQSRSVEQRTSSVRPRVFPNSLSESALSGLPIKTTVTANGGRLAQTPESVLDEDEGDGTSLDESRDSSTSQVASSQGGESGASSSSGSKKKSSKNKLFKFSFPKKNKPKSA